MTSHEYTPRVRWGNGYYKPPSRLSEIGTIRRFKTLEFGDLRQSQPWFHTFFHPHIYYSGNVIYAYIMSHNMNGTVDRWKGKAHSFGTVMYQLAVKLVKFITFTFGGALLVASPVIVAAVTGHQQLANIIAGGIAVGILVMVVGAIVSMDYMHY